MPEVTKDYVHIPVKDKKKNAKIVTITLSDAKGIKALYDVKNKEIITYLFSTEKFNTKKAKKWIKEHSSLYENAAVVCFEIDSMIRGDIDV